MLKDKVHAIPREGQSAGCFEWYEAETGGTFASDSFDGTRDWIIQHRKSNPRHNKPTDEATVEAEMHARYDARLRSQYGAKASQWLMGPPGAPGAPGAPSPPSFSWPLLRSRAAVASVAAGTSKVKAGVGLIVSWLGDGLRPTDQATATKRAETCSVCPLNVHLEGLQKAVGTVGEFLHMVMSAKADLKLSTPFDEKLFQCSACLCQNSAKVWVPAEHIRKGMTPEIKAALDAKCWQLPLLT